MNRRRRATFPTPDPRARTSSFFPPNPLHPDVPVTTHLPDLPPNPTLTGPLTDAHPHTIRDDIIPIHDPDYPDPHHSDQPRQLKHHPDPAVRPRPVLEEQHSAYVSESYADFLAPLRDNSFAADWVFAWVLSQHPQHDDPNQLNLALSRGFRIVYMCAERGCHPMQDRSALQSCATLLVPCQTRLSVVAGHFIELATDDASNHMRTGRYVYFSSSRELVKVSKVRGPVTAAMLSSVCINRICPIGSGSIVQDHVVVSFPWHRNAGKVPARCVAHSRTLSYSKMLQTAKDAGFAGYGGVGDVMPLTPESGIARVLENSFHGIGSFGVFASTIVPSRFGFGAEAEGHRTPFEVGQWAVPSHMLSCRNFRTLLLGIEANDITSLRSHFVTMYGHVNAQGTRPLRSSVNLSHRQNQGATGEADIRGHQRLEPGAPTQSSVRSMELLSLSAENSGVAPITEAEAFRGARTTGIGSNPQPPPPFAMGAPRAETNVTGMGEVRGGPSSQKGGRDMGSLPTFGSSGLLLPIQPQMDVPRTQAFSSAVDEALKVGPSSVVDTIEAAVSVEPVASSPGVHTGATSALVAPGGPSSGITPASVGGRVQEGGEKKSEVVSVSAPTFKKTLPAPTKNEIVIRNRISAQRSNEKRRRKIEATRTELAYLRTTYLPQLQHRRGSLLTENQTLRQRFMEKYQQQGIESFF